MTKDQWQLLGGVLIALGAWAIIQEGNAHLLKMPPDTEFDPEDLLTGMKVELEHTTSTATAKQIAKAHLLEDEDYYQKLASLHL